jgi:hypothetical protein
MAGILMSSSMPLPFVSLLTPSSSKKSDDDLLGSVLNDNSVYISIVQVTDGKF